jgi:glycosyl transferase family 25
MNSVSGIGIFVVNLDRSPSRMRWMERQLTALGLEFTRIRAIDGDHDDIAMEIARAGLTLGEPAERPLGLREMGCYLSHLKVFRAVQRANLDAACVLEDDVELSRDFPRALRSLAQHRTSTIVAKLEPWRKRRIGVVVDRIGDHRTIYSPQAHIETGAYFVTKAAIQAMTDLDTITRPFDRALFADRRNGPLILSVSPAVAKQSDRFPSLIQIDRDLVCSYWRRMPRIVRELYRPLAQLGDFTREIYRVYQQLGLNGMTKIRYEQVLTCAERTARKSKSIETKPNWRPSVGTLTALRGDRS